MRRPRKLLKAGSDEAGSGLGVSESRRPLSSSSEDSAFVSNSSFFFFFYFFWGGGLYFQLVCKLHERKYFILFVTVSPNRTEIDKL